MPFPKEACLTGGCGARGDCRQLLQGQKVGPPQIPAPPSCWPNQATLSNTCVRLSLLLDRSRLPPGVSTEGLCAELRSLLASHQASSGTHHSLVLLCDIKTGANDTLEVTMVLICTSDVIINTELCNILIATLCNNIRGGTQN